MSPTVPPPSGPSAFNLRQAPVEALLHQHLRGECEGGTECRMEKSGKTARARCWGQSSPGQGPWVLLAQSGQPRGLGPTPWLQTWGLSAGLAAAGREAPSDWEWLRSLDVAPLGVSPGVGLWVCPSWRVVLPDEEAAAAWGGPSWGRLPGASKSPFSSQPALVWMPTAFRMTSILLA